MTIAAIIIVLLVLVLLIGYTLTRPVVSTNDELWESYIAGETSGSARILARTARPIANLPVLQRQAHATKTYRKLEGLLKAGGAYNGSLEIFMAVQVLVTVIALALLAVIAVFSLTGLWLFITAIMAILLLVLPYNQTSTKAKTRTSEVTESLPDFAELLAMVLPNSSIISGLAFTAERTTGPVAEEVRAMVGYITARTLPEVDAFNLCAERLGTTEAQVFITTLMNAYLEGTKALEAINSQAESMRKVAFQNRREISKKLPNKIVIIFGIHFMPALTVTAFLPLILGIGQVLG